MLDTWISKKYRSPDKYTELFAKNTPYEHIILPNFFSSAKLKLVASALKQQPFAEKNSDLFQFSQSGDLKTTRNKVFNDFYKFLSSKEFISYVATLTSTKLSKKIDCSCFVYQSTDYLLPHDDRLEGRKIAYVVNLSSLKEKDGGSLDLFDSRNNQPHTIVKSYAPTFNSLILFRVTPLSFHQVAEVVADKERYTITGWFHG